MIEVDISNVWGAISLTDLLEMESAVSAAHTALTEGTCPGAAYRGWLELPLRSPTEEITRIQKTAEKIRADSDVCVVLGTGGGCLGSRAIVELLQGQDRNTGRGKGDPRLFFAGSGLSTRAWNNLLEQLEEQDYSLIVIADGEMALETAIAFRSLRWKLERKYGTDEAARRIYAIANPDDGALGQMARIAHWETFSLPENVTGPFTVLTAAGLLPMAVAGIDILAVLNGAMDGRESYDLRSFENPVWLYAALRNLLGREGKNVELFATFEPDFHSFGRWWQQLFGGVAGAGPFPVPVEYTADLHFLGQAIAGGQGNPFETLLRFDPPARQHIIGLDWRDLDGLNYLDGKPVDFVEEMAYSAILASHADAGVPVITMDCRKLSDRKTGELIWFLELSCAISAGAMGANPHESPAVEEYRQNLYSLLGRPDPEEP